MDDATTSKYGDCTKQQWYKLQRAVSDACKGSQKGKSCHPGMSKEEALNNAAKFDACAAARDAINKICYGGGDVGHKQQADNARRAAQRCRDIANQCN